MLAGFWLALGYAFAALICFILIIGIPLGLANFKLIPVSLLPFGAEIVPAE